MVLAAVLGTLSLSAAAAVDSPQESSTLSFTMTTTSSYFVTTGGPLTVNFNSVQLDTSSPQAYAFGVVATAAQGFSITRLHWEFGDGIFLDVPYCCHSQVSEVRYHAYQQPGTYTVLVVAYDSGGNFGDAFVTISWPTPVPEFPSVTTPLLASIFMVIAAALLTRRKPSR
jgi:PKD repeat protein